MAVQQRALRHRLERHLKLALLRLPRQEFLEQQGVRRQEARILALDQRRDLVAEAEHAARLEADDRNSARQQRGEGGDAALGLAPRLIDEPDREEGAPAAERATVAFAFGWRR